MQKALTEPLKTNKNKNNQMLAYIPSPHRHVLRASFLLQGVSKVLDYFH